MSGPLNGKTGEFLRWLLGFVVAALVAYFTAQNAADQRITTVDVREQTRWDETARRLKVVEEGQQQMRDSQQRIELLFERVVSDWARGVDRRTLEPLPLGEALKRQQEEQGR